MIRALGCVQENVCERMGVRESVCVRACMCAHLKKRERERIRERGERERVVEIRITKSVLQSRFRL